MVFGIVEKSIDDSQISERDAESIEFSMKILNFLHQPKTTREAVLPLLASPIMGLPNENTRYRLSTM